MDPAEIEDLFDQLEDLSDSGPEVDIDPDTISIGSTPKPSLKPFFCSSRNLLKDGRSERARGDSAAASSGACANGGGGNNGFGAEHAGDGASARLSHRLSGVSKSE